MRSIWKGPFVDTKLLNKIIQYKKNKIFKTLKIWCKNSSIVPNFIGFTFYIYNGKTFLKLFIRETMIGKKIGEFLKTRKFIRHANTKK